MSLYLAPLCVSEAPSVVTDMASIVAFFFLGAEGVADGEIANVPCGNENVLGLSHCLLKTSLLLRKMCSIFVMCLSLLEFHFLSKLSWLVIQSVSSVAKQEQTMD